MKLKVFCINWDGREQRLVAASSQREAASLLGTTLHHVRTHGEETHNETEVAVAMSEPGAVFRSPRLFAPYERLSPTL